MVSRDPSSPLTWTHVHSCGLLPDRPHNVYPSRIVLDAGRQPSGQPSVQTEKRYATEAPTLPVSPICLPADASGGASTHTGHHLPPAVSLLECPAEHLLRHVPCWHWQEGRKAGPERGPHSAPHVVGVTWGWNRSTTAHAETGCVRSAFRNTSSGQSGHRARLGQCARRKIRMASR